MARRGWRGGQSYRFEREHPSRHHAQRGVLLYKKWFGSVLHDAPCIQRSNLLLTLRVFIVAVNGIDLPG